MSENSGISWTDNTFSPWWGCQKVSRACDGCYAEAFAKRVGFKVWGPKAERRFFGDKHWAEPLKWNRAAAERGMRTKVFCSSMADVFEDRRDLDEHRERLWDVIDHTPFLDWQLLTKRPQNMLTMAPLHWRNGWPTYVWAGTTAENQATFDERWEHLRQVPAAVRFVSIEPMIGPVDVRPGGAGDLHQAIFGGESGPGHETLDLDALARGVAAARDRGCAIFVKQDSGPYPGRQGRIPEDLWALKELPKIGGFL